ncbi:MAG: hypothetical protein LBE22_10455 [Azoarcus sp.]|jgi:hypothetical protein|nr:hypothetical protein [Azoarcus sp.]
MPEQSKRTPLPDTLVERIFSQLQGMYGSLWLDRWRDGVQIERGGKRFDQGLLLAKATWAKELAGFADQPKRISVALDACRHRPLPPTLPEFIELCRQAPDDAPAALPEPKPSPEVRAARAQYLAEASRRIASGTFDGTAWARKPPSCPDKSHWENHVIAAANGGDARFIEILREHVRTGVITQNRAREVIDMRMSA